MTGDLHRGSLLPPSLTCPAASGLSLRGADATELFSLAVLQVPMQSCSSQELMTCHSTAHEINAPAVLSTHFRAAAHATAGG